MFKSRSPNCWAFELTEGQHWKPWWASLKAQTSWEKMQAIYVKCRQFPAVLTILFLAMVCCSKNTHTHTHTTKTENPHICGKVPVWEISWYLASLVVQDTKGRVKRDWSPPLSQEGEQPGFEFPVGCSLASKRIEFLLHLKIKFVLIMEGGEFISVIWKGVWSGLELGRYLILHLLVWKWHWPGPWSSLNRNWLEAR